MAILVTADLHLTSAAKDEYRWGVFKELFSHAALENNDVTSIVILGDLTEHKSGHSAMLVNRMVQELYGMPCQVHIVFGNHDGLAGEPRFFQFLNVIKHISTYTIPTCRTVDGFMVRFVPNGQAEAALRGNKIDADIAFLHEGFIGATYSNGQKADKGLKPRDIRKIARHIYSGDIHKPQRVDCVTYVGTPYPVDFDEQHEPRFLLLSSKNGEVIQKSIPLRIMKKYDLHVRTIKELHRVLDKAEPKSGDQAKVSWYLADKDHGLTASIFANIRNAIESYHMELTGGVRFILCEPKGDQFGVQSNVIYSMTEADHQNWVLERFIEKRKVNKRLAKTGHMIARKAK